MTLDNWLKSKKMGRREFSELIGVSYDAVRLWELGKRTPSPQMMAKIYTATRGRVKPADWIKVA